MVENGPHDCWEPNAVCGRRWGFFGALMFMPLQRKGRRQGTVPTNYFSLPRQAVQSVNMSHDAAHAQMDVKLRSLICIGLK